MYLSTAFINDADLTSYMPDVLTFGIPSFSAECLRATEDVYTELLSDWWPGVTLAINGFAFQKTDTAWPTLPIMDVANLDTVTLKQAVVYRALSQYVMPMLSSDADANGDLFSRRADRYRGFYKAEMARVYKLPLYDFNRDSAFTQLERPRRHGRRLLRA